MLVGVSAAPRRGNSLLKVEPSEDGFRSGWRAATGRRWLHFDRPLAMSITAFRAALAMLIVLVLIGVMTPLGAAVWQWIGRITD